MRVTIMFLVHFLLIKRNYVIFDVGNFLVDLDQNTIFSLLTCLRLLQFSYMKIGNFPDDFVSLNEINCFDTLRLAIFMIILSF